MTISAACASTTRFPPSRYTGKERDAESGNDYFGARYYASSMGRWMSPDWSAKIAPVPYATVADPQSLNLYTYLENNPMTHVDADGHGCADLALCRAIRDNGIDEGTATYNANQQKTQLQYQHQPTQQANVPVTISKVKANTPLGHSTVQVGSDQRVGLVPNSDKQAMEAVVKQGAELAKLGVPLPESVPGHIETSSAQVRSSTTIYVTSDQANAMRTYVSGAEHSPQSYDATYHNCVDGFSVLVLRAGGVNAPMDMTPGGLVNDLSH
jgi:RHS repeat-associated protein